ncbi:MAG: trypsin-like peptidase domain-containing protein [Bacteroidota bacterium]
MKNILSLIFAGIVGGLVVLGAMKLGSTNDEIVRAFNQSPSASLVSSSNTNSTLPFDFVKASQQATEVVVHIVAEESIEAARKRNEKRRKSRRSPFDDFFGQDFFGQDFFWQDYFRGNSYPKNGSGSGVIFSKDGYIVTNNHVVGFADNIIVTLEDGREVKATKIGTDPTTDLAVIKIDVDGNLPTLEFGDSDKVQVGEWVLAVGNPFSYLTSTVTAGIVSAKGRDLDIISEDKSIEEFIQTDAAVNPGNSGGALVSTAGELVGINTAIATPTGVYAGYSFAIPSNLVKRIVYDIIENGDIERVNLGVLGYDVDEDLKKEFELNTNSGFYVDSIDKGSAAQFAGILPGDVIVAINNQKIDRFEDIVEVMKYNKAGDTIKLEIQREGKNKKVDVRLRKGL